MFCIDSSRWKLGERCGFVLVGHCFGGLIIKSLVEEAYKRAYGRVENKFDEQCKRRANKFLKNLKGLCFMRFPMLDQSWNPTLRDAAQIGQIKSLE